MKVTTLFAIFLFAPTVNAQWTIVNLHPNGATSSFATGVGDGQQCGYVTLPATGTNTHASLWTGTAASWVDLNPPGPGSPASSAEATSAGQQVGSYSNGGATLWFGTAKSHIDLTPGGYSGSAVYAVDAGKQGGGAVNGGTGQTNALLWASSPNSYTNLHPSGADWSTVYVVKGAMQGGSARFPGPNAATHAGFWSGTAASWVDLHPAGATYSRVKGLDGDYQGGDATIGGVSRAGIWKGTASSWKELAPPGATGSGVSKMAGGFQIGLAVISGAARAILWSGTQASHIDITEYLSPQYTAAAAYGISIEGNRVYIVGGAHNSSVNRQEAVMWISELITPTYTLIRGIGTAGNQQSIVATDDDRLVIRPGVVFNTAQPPVEVRFDCSAPSDTPNGFTFSIESSASFGNAQQKLLLWNYDTGAYETLDTRTLSTVDDVAHVTVRTNPERFIEDGTLAVRGAVSVKAVGPSFSYPWNTRIDKVWMNFPG